MIFPYLNNFLFFEMQIVSKRIASFVLYLICRYSDVIMSAMASPITSLTSFYSIVYSGAEKNQRKHQSSASLALCGEFIPAQGPVTRKTFHLMTSSCVTELKCEQSTPMSANCNWKRHDIWFHSFTSCLWLQNIVYTKYLKIGHKKNILAALSQGYFC